MIAEGILLESKSGSRKGCGCIDMIFVARWLMEKAHEHKNSLFVMYVNLRKACDSIPQEALLKSLECWEL